MIDFKKQAEMDWAFANRACDRILSAMSLLPITHPMHAKLSGQLDAERAKRSEAGDRIHAADMAMIENRRGV